MSTHPPATARAPSPASPRSSDDSRRSRRRRALIVAIFWLLTGVLPFGSLLLEYGSELGWLVAKTYSHFFLFPLIVGPTMAAFVLPPIEYFGRTPEVARLFKQIAVAALLLTLALFALEFAGATAVFEIKPERLRTAVGDAPAGPGESPAATLETFFRQPPPYLAPSAPGAEAAAAQRVSFQNTINALAKSSENRSATRGLYLLSFLCLTWTLVFLLMVILVVAFARGSGLIKNQPKIRLQVLCLAAALLFSAVWPVMRTASESVSQMLYAAPSMHGVVPVVATLFLVASICLVAIVWERLSEILMEVLTALATLCVAGISFAPEHARKHFGRDLSFQLAGAQVLAYLAVITAFVFVMRQRQRKSAARAAKP